MGKLHQDSKVVRWEATCITANPLSDKLSHLCSCSMSEFKDCNKVLVFQLGISMLKNYVTLFLEKEEINKWKDKWTHTKGEKKEIYRRTKKASGCLQHLRRLFAKVLSQFIVKIDLNTLLLSERASASLCVRTEQVTAFLIISLEKGKWGLWDHHAVCPYASLTNNFWTD